MIVASVLVCAGLVSSAVANGTTATAAKASSSATTKAPPALSASTMNADLAKLKSGKRLSARQLKKLGLKQVSRKELARIKQLRKQSTGARTAQVGATPWYTWRNARNSWADRRYSGPYWHITDWQPYYVVYDNWKTCTYSGTGCIDAHAYTYKYLLRWRYNGLWYYYDTTGYTTDPYGPGWGPYPS